MDDLLVLVGGSIGSVPHHTIALTRGPARGRSERTLRTLGDYKSQSVNLGKFILKELLKISIFDNFSESAYRSMRMHVKRMPPVQRARPLEFRSQARIGLSEKRSDSHFHTRQRVDHENELGPVSNPPDR